MSGQTAMNTDRTKLLECCSLLRSRHQKVERDAEVWNVVQEFSPGVLLFIRNSSNNQSESVLANRWTGLTARCRSGPRMQTDSSNTAGFVG